MLNPQRMTRDASAGRHWSRLLGVFGTLAVALAGCGGGGGDGDDTPVPDITVSGTATYQKVPFSVGAPGLDYNAIVNAPIRGAVLELIDAGDRTTIRATTTTDASGNYSVQVGSGRSLFVRVKAQLVQTGTPEWNFRVLNNTNADALYALDSADFTTGTAPVTINVNAASGWTGASYGATRAAAPFSLLDVAYEMYTLVLTANANAEFAPLNIFWSTQNAPTPDFNPDTGEIVTTSYLSGGADAGVYVLGLANTDTDEYDQHVIAHELGHYFQDVFSRDDSLGGSHGAGDLLDLRVAFSEGWGNAFSGMVKNDSRYRDSLGNDQSNGFVIDVEQNAAIGGNPGWFSEGSVHALIYDFFDSAADGMDSVALGFAPIYAVMNSEMRLLEPHTAIFPFVAALKTRNPAAAAGIDDLVNGQQITSLNINELGVGEMNSAGDALNLPIYVPIDTLGSIVRVCSSTSNGEYNALGNRKFLRFNLTVNRQVSMRADVVGAAAKDPDLALHRQGLLEVSETDSRQTRFELLTTSLAPGNYVLEVYDFFAIDPPPTPPDPVTDGNTCMDVSVITTI